MKHLTLAAVTLTALLSACSTQTAPTPTKATAGTMTAPKDLAPAQYRAPVRNAMMPAPASPSAWRGMTWRLLDEQNGVVRVGADAATDPYAGDTDADTELPLLCLNPDGRPAPAGLAVDFYNGWAGGEVRVTPPITGRALTSLNVANQVCATEFGAGWRMAEFHDGQADGQPGGWRFYANGTVPATTRFWVAINDQNANPWNSDGAKQDTVVPATTRVLGEQDRAGLLSVSPDGRVLEFSSSSPVLATLQPGHTVASRPTPAAPNGVLGKVTGIVPSGATTFVYTTDVALEEIIQDGDIEASADLSSSNIDYARSGAMIQAQQRNLQAQKTFKLFSFNKTPFCLYNHDGGRTLNCDDGDANGLRSQVPSTNYVTLDGLLNAEANAFINLKIRWFSLKYFDAGVQLSEQARMVIDGKGSYNWGPIKKDLTQWQVVFNPITFNIGPVPVVITPMLVPTFGTDGQLNATLHYEVTQSFNAKYGVKYDKDSGNGWETINERGGTPLSQNGSANGSAQANVYLGAKGILAFYRAPGTDGLAQVYAHVKAFAEGKATASAVIGQGAQAQVCVDGGVRADVGIKLPLIRRDPWETQVAEWKRQLGCWKAGQPTGGNSSTPYSNVTLNFTDMYGSAEIYRIDPYSGAETLIGTMGGNGSFDATPHLNAAGDTVIKISSIAKRSSGVFGSYRRSIDLAVSGNGQSIYDPTPKSCTGCHSSEVYRFTVNKADGTISW
ncbi:hypothetical protein [Deinococcus maricopensis]|uniref:Lipoprotein n=1 Tax=Deinococcus maricopensis (strain DSM 21211 / LMG 22137 / NRRL B-23946 / LB-34) TaxID=709986 RepID=E8U3U3_DEIML|nr:hypothetical protein [Deinococcus maricopensis]ADV68786.1 hypothetical protein Deima_3158 [Deinococcus maricopensis DSM 21211]